MHAWPARDAATSAPAASKPLGAIVGGAVGGALLLGLLAGALCILLRRRRSGKGAAGLPRVSTGAPNGNGMVVVPDKDSAEGWQPALQRQLLPVRHSIYIK